MPAQPVTRSLKRSRAISDPRIIPERFVWDNYLYILKELPFATWFLNSVLVALAVTLGTLFVDALAAFAFAKKQFWGRDFLFGLSMVTVNSASSGVS